MSTHTEHLLNSLKQVVYLSEGIVLIVYIGDQMLIQTYISLFKQCTLCFLCCIFVFIIFCFCKESC